MADNSTLPTVTGNEVFKNRDVGGIKWPELVAYFGDTGAGIPIKDAVGFRLPVLATQNGTWTVAVSGTTTVSGTVSISGTVAATQSGVWNVGLSSSLPTGANVIGAVTQSGTWNVTVSNTSIPVTQSGIWNIGSITTLPAITGTVTANQGGTWTVSINPAQLSPPGQTTSANSAGVVLASDSNGPYSAPASFVSGTTAAMTGTTSTSLLAAPAAGLRNYVTQITVSNSHATVGTDILIQDGSGGTTLYVIPAAANYGGSVITFPTPLRQPTTATALFCANVTTGSSTKVSASGYKGA